MTDIKPPSFAMTMFVVYKNPSDHPGQYVVRKWLGLHPNPSPEIVTPDLEKARASIPSHLYRLPRFQSDDPAILEVWL